MKKNTNKSSARESSDVLSAKEVIAQIQRFFKDTKKSDNWGLIISLIFDNVPDKNADSYRDVVVSHIMTQPWFSKFTMAVVPKYNHKLNETCKSIVRRASIECRRRCKFPVEDNRAVFQGRTAKIESEEIEYWIKSNSKFASDGDWCRMVAVSIFSMEEDGLSESNLHLLYYLMKYMRYVQDAPKSRQKQKKEEVVRQSHRVLLRRLSTLFTTETSLKAKLSSILDIWTPYWRKMEETRQYDEQLEVKLRQLSDELQERHSQIGALVEELEAVKRDHATQHKELAKAIAAIEEREERIAKLSRWSDNAIESEVVEQIAKLKRSIRHEVVEISLSLTAEPPNVSMALDRIEQVSTLISVDQEGRK